MLYTKTIDEPLWKLLRTLSTLPELQNFYLVGGTALALQFGHRKSEDLDFFTNGSFDIADLKRILLDHYPHLELLRDSPHELSFVIALDRDDREQRKVDIYNWAVKFIRPAIIEDGIRLASPEDIAAFKLDSIGSRKEQKDYVDLSVLCDVFSFEEMMDFFSEKFPYKDKRTVLTEILNTEGIEKSDRPEMLIDLTLPQSLEKIKKSVRNYTNQIIQKDLAAKTQLEKTRENLVQKKGQNKGKEKPA
ncbi:MAG: nucleotidyl transferase AbiEii/AbiGii toxin family protein [Ginsengibacter sp.]